MKRLIVMFLMIALAVTSLGLSGCGGSTSNDKAQATPPRNATQAVPVPAAPDYSKYLTIADVEKVSGISGIKLVPKDPSKGAGGDLNFATADEKLVLMAGFHGASMYKRYSPDTIHSTVTGIGEEAFIGPKQTPQYVLTFRKGQHTVALNTFFKLGGNHGETMLTMDQLKQLAKIVEGRL